MNEETVFDMGKRRSVALVMPVRNEEASIVETLESVLASSRLPDECICADGMSTDNTVKLINSFADRGLKLRVVENPTLFCGGGRNRAIEATDCEIILIADFGNLVDKYWIENMVRPFETDSNVDVVAGMFKPRVHSEFEHCMASIHYYEDYTLDRYSDEEKIKLLPKTILPGGMSIGLTKEIWRRAEGFPEWLAKAQDKMFSRKTHALGAKVVVAWNAYVYHHMRSTPLQVFKQLYFYGRGNGQMHFVSSHFIKLAAFYLFFIGLLLAGSLSTFFYILAAVVMLAYVFHSGIKKIYRADPKRFAFVHVLLAPTVLFPRDIGSLLGHVAGWVQWYFVPRYRKLFNVYTQKCRSSDFNTIAN
jgi:glycosyltransferase involved in cell wall biosynthesis